MTSKFSQSTTGPEYPQESDLHTQHAMMHNGYGYDIPYSLASNYIWRIHLLNISVSFKFGDDRYRSHMHSTLVQCLVLDLAISANSQTSLKLNFLLYGTVIHITFDCKYFMLEKFHVAKCLFNDQKISMKLLVVHACSLLVW